MGAMARWALQACLRRTFKVKWSARNLIMLIHTPGCWFRTQSLKVERSSLAVAKMVASICLEHDDFDWPVCARLASRIFRWGLLSWSAMIWAGPFARDWPVGCLDTILRRPISRRCSLFFSAIAQKFDMSPDC